MLIKGFCWNIKHFFKRTLQHTTRANKHHFYKRAQWTSGRIWHTINPVHLSRTQNLFLSYFIAFSAGKWLIRLYLKIEVILALIQKLNQRKMFIEIWRDYKLYKLTFSCSLSSDVAIKTILDESWPFLLCQVWKIFYGHLCLGSLQNGGTWIDSKVWLTVTRIHLKKSFVYN